MTSDEQAIANLLFRYGQAVDDGRFDDVGRMFAHGSYGSGAHRSSGDAVAAQLKAMVMLYDDGTPRTQHVTSNLDIVVSGGRAEARSLFTVLQQVDALPPAVVCAGRYHDRLERVDGEWVFRDRDITMRLVGDLSRHLRSLPRPSERSA